MANCLYLHHTYITKFDFMNYGDLVYKLKKIDGSSNFSA